jgi:hypothetical protein
MKEQAVRLTAPGRGGRGAGAAGRVPASSGDVLASFSVRHVPVGVFAGCGGMPHPDNLHYANVMHDVILLGLMLATMVWAWLMLWTIVKPQRKWFGDTDGFRR